MALAAIQCRIAQGKPVTHQGVLKIRSSSLPWWHRRRCVLDGCVLQCFPVSANEGGDAETEAVHGGPKHCAEWIVRDILQWHGVGTPSRNAFAFVVATESGSELQLMAGSEEERDTWLAALSLALEALEVEEAGPAASPRGRISQWKQAEEPEYGEDEAAGGAHNQHDDQNGLAPGASDAHEHSSASRHDQDQGNHHAAETSEPFVRVLLGDVEADEFEVEGQIGGEEPWIDVKAQHQAHLQAQAQAAARAQERASEWVEC